jgi:hypothetical protein
MVSRKQAYVDATHTPNTWRLKAEEPDTAIVIGCVDANK